jgi:hypothetical protein
METATDLKARILRCYEAIKADGFNEHNARLLNAASASLFNLTGEFFAAGSFQRA